MAKTHQNPLTIDPSSGYNPTTSTFHSLRPPVPLPSTENSVAAFAFSLLPSPLPTNPAFIFSQNSTTLSFSSLISRSLSLANALSSIVTHSTVSFVLAPTSLDIPVLYFALLSLGSIISPANPLSTPSDISHLISLSKPSIAFTTTPLASKLPSNLPLILIDSPEFKSYQTYLHPSLIKRSSIDDVSPEYFEKNLHQFIPAKQVKHSDIAAALYSSGTTGLVKAVAIPHRSFISQIKGFVELRQKPKRGRQGHDVTLLGAPLFHSLGFMFLLLGVAKAQTTVLMGGVRGIEEMVRLAERYRVTHMTVAPPVIVAMSKLQAELGELEEIICGGAPVPEIAAKLFMERFPGVDLCQGYGSTEGGGISRMINSEECRIIKSAGRLTQNVQVKIVDINTGNFLGVGQDGEIWLKSPSVMIGYVGDEKANASTFDSNGWLKTGDIGHIDKKGFLFIVDRLKELIKYKAYQVPPAELESLLQLLPGVADAAVVPYPDEEAGEIPMAFIVREPGYEISAEEVMKFVAEKVAPYKKIRKVAFINCIPKSPSGKILRRELRIHIMSNSIAKL